MNTKITWKQFEKDIASLVKKIPKGKFNKLLIVSKGGLIPGYFLAKELGIDLVQTICVKTERKEGLKPVPHFITSKAGDDFGWLVVDDLIDSGETMKHILEKMPRASAAVLYLKELTYKQQKEGGRKLPENIFYSKYVKPDWVDFPWE